MRVVPATVACSRAACPGLLQRIVLLFMSKSGSPLVKERCIEFGA